jgi:hypothetical protein
MPVIPATWETENKRIVVRGHPRKILHRTPSSKKPEQNELEVWFKQCNTCFANVKP